MELGKPLPPMKTQSFSGALMCAFFFASTISIFAQGPLTPPGAPAPMMKTLDQVEARTPLAGGTSPVTIGSGSYYLTGSLNISSTSANGITVSGSNVTLDLNGFTLTGPSSGTGAGVYLTGGISNVTVVNGTIRNWGLHGINALGNPSLRAEKLRVISNGGIGIAADVNAEVINCFAQSNASTGILGTDNCLIKDCQITGTTGSPGHGLSLGLSAMVSGCVASGNSGNGIFSDDGAVVIGCVARGNTLDGIRGSAVKDCAARNNGGSGINGTIVESCNSAANAAWGILTVVATNCYASAPSGGGGIQAYGTAMNCYGSTSGGSGSGIYAENAASNCFGNSTNGIGLHAAVIAIGCHGYTYDGTGLVAFLANSCRGSRGTATGTAESITYRYNMPP
jgi:hypothetical protein